jgi:LURP-one-related
MPLLLKFVRQTQNSISRICLHPSALIYQFKNFYTFKIVGKSPINEPVTSLKVLLEGAAAKGEPASLVAEIKRKVDPDAHVVMGKDVFSLFLVPHVDAAFVMGLVLVLDQVCSDEPSIIEEEIDSSMTSLAGDHHIGVNGGTLLEEHPSEVVM